MKTLASLVNRLLGRLGVGRKLMLIYLLDLSAVIYVSGILINEKFIAIDFARKEVQGNAYIAALREPLLAAARVGGGETGVAATLPALAQGVAQAEALHGRGLDSQRLAAGLQATLHQLAADADVQRAGTLLQQGRDLLTRIGNQSNLILDPDLDSYYTMSLVVLRYPELLEVVHDTARVLQLQDAPQAPPAAELRTRYLIAEGRLVAVARAIGSDHAEAFAAGGPALAQALRPSEQALVSAIDGFRATARAAMDGQGLALQALPGSEATLRQALQQAWGAAGEQLATLLQRRIDNQYTRMAVHLGTALALLLVILTVVTVVARSIARPLRQLAGVADEVRRTGDHSLRATWHGTDEVGRLVTTFNGMLGELDRERIVKQELVASARAAQAEQALVEATPIAMVVTAIPGHEVLHANPPAGDWLGDCRHDPWRDGLDSPVRGRFFQQLADRGAVDEFEVHWRGRSWAVLAARQVRWQGRDAVLTTFTPINHLKLMEHRLELWAKVFEASSEAIVIVDAGQRILSVNRAFSRHTGYEPQDVLGEPPGLMMGGAAGLPEALWRSVLQRGSWQGEIVVRRRVGGDYPAWLVVNAVRQHSADVHERGNAAARVGEVSHYIFTSIDISDRKRSEQRIRFLAEHDVLTELPNRSLCVERLRHAVQQAQARAGRAAVLFIDLDRFKQINDSLGHHIGDGLLRSVAQRLVQAVREGDTVSRLGGDEFVIVLPQVHSVDEVQQIVQRRLVPLIRLPHPVDGAELHVSCSVGVAVYPDDGDDIDTLMRHADTAMYQAKAQGRDGVQFFSAEMAVQAETRQSMEDQLRHALEQGQLHLVWQPQVQAATGTPTGVEGLLRWQHPQLGLVPPSQFIPIAEETGLIVPIGAWVIEQACRQVAAWRSAGLPPLTVAINLSARQLRDATLIDTVRTQLGRHRVPPGVLELELTESMVMDGAEHNLAQLHALRDLGVSLAVDDFGTGYSSLAYLSRFPIEKLKIDRSFVLDMKSDPADRAITTAVIGLGHALGLQVVAEGVEDEAQAALLRASGCDALQGYLFARPLPTDEATAWLRQARQPLRVANIGR